MSESKKFAIMSIVFSGVGLILNCAGLGWILGIVGVVMGIVSIKKKEALKGLAIAGIIIGALVILGGIIALVIGFISGAAVGLPMIIGILESLS